ncbi:MAG: hypothetical protein ACJ75Z_13365 [Solirubrobacterales bacterium]
MIFLGALAAGVSISASAAPKRVGGLATFTLTPPPAGERSAPFTGKVSSPRAFCRSHRSITLTPTSPNFPNTTGYIVHVRSTAKGTFSGIYTTPKKAGTSRFSLQVTKVRRKVKGQIYLCQALRATAASVTTTG